MDKQNKKTLTKVPSAKLVFLSFLLFPLKKFNTQIRYFAYHTPMSDGTCLRSNLVHISRIVSQGEIKLK